MTKLILFGDNDTTSDARAVNIAIIKEENVDQYCFIGDGPYSKTGTKWVAMMKESFDDKKDKMIWSRGNHDEDESESKQTQKDMEAWFPEAKGVGISDCWISSKIVGNVYIISMDSQDMDVEFKRDQFNFVQAELAKAKQLRTEGKIDWIVALFHKPAFTLKSSHSPYTAVRFLYKELFRDAQIDFWVHGHNHNTQLWLPMIPNQSEANGEGEQLFTKLPDGTFDFSKDHGWIGIVTGHAGHEWNGINDSGTGIANVLYKRDSGKFGYTVIETNGKKAKILAKDTDNATVFEYPPITREGTIVPPEDCSDPAKCIDSQTGECRPVGINEHKSPTDGSCQPNITPENPKPVCTCPDGYTFVEETHTCRKKDTNPEECKPNWYFNLERNRCIPKLIPDDDTAPPGVDARFKTSQLKAKVGSTVEIDGSESTGAITSFTLIQDGTDVTRVTLTDVPGKKYTKSFVMPDTNELLDFVLTVKNDPSGVQDIDRCSVQREDIIVPPGDFDAFGMQLLMKILTNKVAMEKGSDHRNGQRYNVNHKFENHLMQGYYKLGKGQAKIETKEDGPNHGSCDFFDDQICFWLELGIDLLTGKGESQYEWHHADNFDIPDEKNTTLDTVGPLKAGNWFGWATCCYWGTDGLRHYKAWGDPTPFPDNDPTKKPNNNWKLLVHLIHTADLIKTPKPITIPRDMKKVMDYDKGFECEIRCHKATSHDTEMKNAWVFEIEPLGTPHA